jgi:hypothetical protein
MDGVLSSDILESQFGPTEIAVLYQNVAERISCTQAVKSGQALELSHVTFIQPGAKKFPRTHQAVLAGQSIGKVFRNDGIEFRREVSAAYHQTLPANLGRWFGNHKPATVVAVSILAGNDKTAYAEILEIYSPAVSWPQLIGSPAAGHLAIIRSVDEFLASQSVVR